MSRSDMRFWLRHYEEQVEIDRRALASSERQVEYWRDRLADAEARGVDPLRWHREGEPEVGGPGDSSDAT